ncbi:hypothetical protein, partial [Caenispirillum bisanense]
FFCDGRRGSVSSRAPVLGLKPAMADAVIRRCDFLRVMYNLAWWSVIGLPGITVIFLAVEDRMSLAAVAATGEGKTRAGQGPTYGRATPALRSDPVVTNNVAGSSSSMSLCTR